MYHPAAALRQGALKATMQRDMAAVPEVLMRARAGRKPATSNSAPHRTSPSTEPATPPVDSRSGHARG